MSDPEVSVPDYYPTSFYAHLKHPELVVRNLLFVALIIGTPFFDPTMWLIPVGVFLGHNLYQYLLFRLYFPKRTVSKTFAEILREQEIEDAIDDLNGLEPGSSREYRLVVDGGECKVYDPEASSDSPSGDVSTSGRNSPPASVNTYDYEAYELHEVLRMAKDNGLISEGAFEDELLTSIYAKSVFSEEDTIEEALPEEAPKTALYSDSVEASLAYNDFMELHPNTMLTVRARRLTMKALESGEVDSEFRRDYPALASEVASFMEQRKALSEDVAGFDSLSKLLTEAGCPIRSPYERQWVRTALRTGQIPEIVGRVSPCIVAEVEGFLNERKTAAVKDAVTESVVLWADRVSGQIAYPVWDAIRPPTSESGKDMRELWKRVSVDKPTEPSQLSVVRAEMAKGDWTTLAALSASTGFPEASVSARLRDLRKPKFGGHSIEKRRVGRNQFEYRMAS